MSNLEIAPLIYSQTPKPLLLKMNPMRKLFAITTLALLGTAAQAQVAAGTVPFKTGDEEYTFAGSYNEGKRTTDTSNSQYNENKTQDISLATRYGYFIDTNNEALVGLSYDRLKSKTRVPGVDDVTTTTNQTDIGAGYRYNFVKPGQEFIPFADLFVDYTRLVGGGSKNLVSAEGEIGGRYLVAPSVSVNVAAYYNQNITQRDSVKNDNYGVRLGFSWLNRL